MMNQTTTNSMGPSASDSLSMPNLASNQNFPLFATILGDNGSGKKKAKKKRYKGQKGGWKKDKAKKMNHPTIQVPTEELLSLYYHLGGIQKENQILWTMAKLATAAQKGTLDVNIIESGYQLLGDE